MNIDDLTNRFSYHPPKGDQAVRYAEIRRHALELGSRIIETTPKSREQRKAITQLEKAVFWANAAIARHE